MSLQATLDLLKANNVRTSGFFSVVELRALTIQVSVYLPNPQGAVTLLYSGKLGYVRESKGQVFHYKIRHHHCCYSINS
jgi:hypothetical protein